MIRNGLEMAGSTVLEAASLDEAIGILEKHPVDAVVSALDFPPDGRSALLKAVRFRPEWDKIPILAVGEAGDRVLASAVRSAGFLDYQAKNDTAAILESLAQLVPAAIPAGPATERSREER
jgi:CheY-like chemotaxis protein